MGATVAVIAARVASTRLPSKVLLEVAGHPLLWHVVNRVRRCKSLDAVVVATGDSLANAPLVELCHREGWPCFVGSEDDVLSRFAACAERYRASVVVRITGDCPLIDPDVIAAVVSFRAGHGYDYASNIHPPTLPDGLDVEAFTLPALRRADRAATLKSEREHVTPWLLAHLPPQAIGNFAYARDYSSYRLTVDGPGDLALVRRLMALGGEHITWQRAVMYLRADPELQALVAGVARNEGYQRSLLEDAREGVCTS